MKYSCDICRYDTTDRGNFFRHNRSSKHIKKCDDVKKIKLLTRNVLASASRPSTSTCREENYICEFCHKFFTKDSSYYRHKKYRCKLKNLNVAPNNLLIEVAVLKSQLAMKDDALQSKSTENEFHKKLTVGAGQAINKSLSAMAFIMQNFQNANPLQPIPHEEFKRLVYEENAGKKIHKNKKISD